MTASAALLIAGILMPSPAPVEPYREPAFLTAVQDASATTALAVQGLPPRPDGGAASRLSRPAHSGAGVDALPAVAD